MFITVGNKDHCGHEHTTFEEAQICLNDYIDKCRKRNKISNRIILEMESIEQLEDEMQIY